MAKILRTLFVVVCVLNFCSEVNAANNLDSISWQVGNEDVLNQSKPEEIAYFLNKTLPENWDDIPPEYIESYFWFDIDGDKNLELFVTLDSSTRGFPNELLIYTSNEYGKQFVQNEFVWMLERIDLAILDLDKDGTYELLLPKLLGYYRGAGACPIWTAVYRWRNQKFIRCDSEFRNFYKDQLLPLDLQIEKIRQENWIPQFVSRDKEDDVEYIESLRIDYEREMAIPIIVRDKILRLLGIRSKAGYKMAREWIKTSDRELRQNAVIVFRDIFDEESQKQLEGLVKDADPIIALEARFAIESHQKSEDD